MLGGKKIKKESRKKAGVEERGEEGQTGSGASSAVKGAQNMCIVLAGAGP